MDGFEATRRIRSLEEKKWGKQDSSIPIIGYTATEAAQDLSKCTASGMDTYLLKPVRITTLTHVLNSVLPRVLRRQALSGS